MGIFGWGRADLGVAVQLASLVQRVTRLESQMADVQSSLANLTAKVNAEATVEASAMALLQGLSAEIAALKSGNTDAATAAAIDALAAQVDSQTQGLAAAVTANTQS